MKARISHGGELRPQRERAAAAVLEGVHLLRRRRRSTHRRRARTPRCARRPASRRSRSRPGAAARSACRGRRGSVRSPAAECRTRPSGPAKWLGAAVVASPEPPGARRGPLTAPAPSRRPAAAASARYGLVARSRPIVVAGPWPGSTTVSSSSGRTTSASSTQHLVPRAAGQVDATDRAGEQDVAGEQSPAPHRGRGTNIPTRGVARRVPHGEVDPRQRQDGAVVEPAHLRGVGQPDAADQRGQLRAVPASGSDSMPKSSGCR